MSIMSRNISSPLSLANPNVCVGYLAAAKDRCIPPSFPFFVLASWHRNTANWICNAEPDKKVKLGASQI